MSKEYIEKEAAQLYAKNIREYLNELYDDGWITITDIDWRVLMSLILTVNDIPPADVVPVVKGEWKGEVASNLYRTRICSVCGERTAEDLFCSRCGADMRKEEDDE